MFASCAAATRPSSAPLTHVAPAAASARARHTRVAVRTTQHAASKAKMKMSTGQRRCETELR